MDYTNKGNGNFEHPDYYNDSSDEEMEEFHCPLCITDFEADPSGDNVVVCPECGSKESDFEEFIEEEKAYQKKLIEDQIAHDSKVDQQIEKNKGCY